MLTDPADTNQITSEIIGAAIAVHRELGPGLLESVYIPCLVMELHDRGLSVDTQVSVPVVYKRVRLDVAYRIDILVAGTAVVEVKSVEGLLPIHRAQLLTYLKLGKHPVGLLINFNVPVLKDGVTRMINPAMGKSTI